MMIRKLLFLILMIAPLPAMACDCGEILPEVNKEEADKFDIIFTGRIDSLRTGKRNCDAWFNGLVLYKGTVARNIHIVYDCITTCRMPFNPGETWIIYADKDSASGAWIVSFCGRSRPKLAAGMMDDYIVYSGITYEQEVFFLETNYPKKDFSTVSEEQEVASGDKTVIDATRPLEQTDTRQKIWLVAGSLIGVVLIYVVVKRMK